MEVTEKRQNGVIVLVPKGRLDSNTSDDFEKRLLGLVGAGETSVVIDFKDLDYISSAGLRVLLKAAKELKKKNGQIAFCAVKDYIREIFELSGFVSFFPIHPTLEDSLKIF
jgi:anti-sigma B factor antagonist